MTPDQIWLLHRIVWKTALGRPNQKNIFQGCYDVFYCEQDEIDAYEIPKRRLQEAEDLGLIERFSDKYTEKFNDSMWALTPKGVEELAKAEDCRDYLEVEGRITGDGECWCLEVTADEYRKICGEDDYQQELEYREEDKGGLPPLDKWHIYPNHIFSKAMGVDFPKGKIKFRLEVLEQED